MLTWEVPKGVLLSWQHAIRLSLSTVSCLRCRAIPIVSCSALIGMSRFGNTLSMLGAAFSCLCLREPRLWKQIHMGFEERRGSRLEQTEPGLIRDMAAFHVWVRFSWRCGSDNLPPSPVDRSSRSEVNSRLIRVVETADIIADKGR